MRSERVEFHSNGCVCADGIKLVGTLFVPEGAGPDNRIPAIGLCGGLNMGMGAVLGNAAAMAEAGYVTLAFEYSGFGEAEGMRAAPMHVQVDNVRCAVTYLRTREEADPERIGVHGQSLGGSNVVVAAALDKRIKCVSSDGPVGDGYDWLWHLHGQIGFRAILERVERDRVQRVLHGRSDRISPASEEICVHPPREQEWWRRIEREADWYGLRDYTVYTGLESILEFRPKDFAHLIAPRPLLVQAQEASDSVPLQDSLTVYESAGEPKELIVWPAGVVSYRKDRYLVERRNGSLVLTYKPEVLAAVIDFFDRHLAAAPQDLRPTREMLKEHR
jgi:fermentation-respiration switch protein FrsA (DUF1100 family)